MMLRPQADWPAVNAVHNPSAVDERPWVVVCGDVHLRQRANDPFYRFLAACASKPPHHLIILGDLFDYWLDSPQFVGLYDELFAHLRTLHQQGCQLHLVLGNRELVAGCHLQAAFPGRVYLRQIDLHCVKGRIRVVHGDRLVRDPGYRMMAAVLRSWWFRSVQACAPLLMHRWFARCIRATSRRRGRKVAELGPPLRILDPRRVAASGRGCRALLAGHIHQVWQHRIRGIAFHLCGHWDEGIGRWVEVTAEGEILHRQGEFIC